MIQKLQSERNGEGDEQEISVRPAKRREPDAKGGKHLFSPQRTDELLSRQTGREDRRAKGWGSERERFFECSGVCSIDEAHRATPCGCRYQNLPRRYCPTPRAFGFTGTPIEEKNKKKTLESLAPTRPLFLGRRADGAIVKILYEWEVS